jgi:hypothetical protein
LVLDVANLLHFKKTTPSARSAIFPVASELNSGNRTKSNIFHVDIFYIEIISFAIFDGNLKTFGDKNSRSLTAATNWR